MILSEIFRAQEEVSRSQSGSPITKAAKLVQRISKIAQKTLSDPAGDRAAATSVINHPLKRPKVNLLGLKRAFSDHKMASRPSKLPKSANKTSKITKNTVFSGSEPDICYIDNRPFFFH